MQIFFAISTALIGAAMVSYALKKYLDGIPPEGKK